MASYYEKKLDEIEEAKTPLEVLKVIAILLVNISSEVTELAKNTHNK